MGAMILRVLGLLLGSTLALQAGAQPLTDQVILKLDQTRDRIPEFVQDRLKKRVGLNLRFLRPLGEGRYVIKLPSQKSISELKSLGRRLAQDAVVQSFEPDYRVRTLTTPDDLEYLNQWFHYENTGGANSDLAWDVTTGSADTVIAVVDTGVLPHADLDGRILSGYDFITDVDTANDGDGRDSDASDPGDWTAADECGAGSSATDSSWHGLHVTGVLAAASNNAQGVAGINWNAKVLPVRAIGKCGGYLSDVVDGMRWAAGLSVSGVTDNANPAQVINLSLGVNAACSDSMQSAIDDVVAAGSFVVAAAGNSSLDLESNDVMPAECNNVIAVASTTRSGALASYSNYGQSIAISAPGGEDLANGIVSTYNTGTQSPSSDSYEAQVGTSMAAPVVSGAISLMLAVQPNLNLSQVLSLLQATARTFPTGTGADCTTADCGAGIVDIEAAVIAAQNMVVADPSEVNFSTLTPRQSSESNVTIKNLSPDQAVQVNSISISGDSAFHIKTDECSNQTIAASSSCLLTVGFSSDSTGSFTAVIDIPNDTTLGAFSVPVAGQVKAESQTSSTSSEFGSGCAVEQAFHSHAQKDEILASFRLVRDHWQRSFIGRRLIGLYYAGVSDLLKGTVLKTHWGEQKFRQLSLFLLDRWMFMTEAKGEESTDYVWRKLESESK